MDDCVFCKIVKREIPCAKIWENDEFLAFLDIRPAMRGMTLVIPKSHYGSYFFDQDKELLIKLLEASKIVAKRLEKAFGISRVALVAEGAGVNHLHIKLYPMHGYTGTFKEVSSQIDKYFENYEGYISTQTGPVREFKELEELATFIKSRN